MTKNILRTFLQSCVCLLAPAFSLAETKSLTIDVVLERALSVSPIVKEIEARIAGQRAQGVSSSLVANPTLDSEVRVPVSYRDARRSDEVAVALSQPLRASDFGVRARVNALIQNTAGAEQKIAMLAFSQRLRLAYAKTWALERRVSQLNKFLQRASLLESSVKRAGENGFLGAGERHLFKAEALKAQYQLVVLSSDVARSRAELSKSAGFVVEGTLGTPVLLPLPAVSELLAPGPELSGLARATLALKLANEQQRLAELDAFPKFAPRLVYERTAEYSDYVGVGISIELPFFDRNQAEKATRASEASAARSTQQYFSGDGFRQEVSALHASIAAATDLLAGYDTEIIPTLQEALAAEDKLLVSGQGSLMRVWQTLRELSAAESETIERSIKAYSDRAELAVLTGKDF